MAGRLVNALGSAAATAEAFSDMATLRHMLRFEAALDHHARAAPDHLARTLVGDGGKIFAREDDVERGDEIGRGIDERAVEIEDDGGRKRHARAGKGRGDDHVLAQRSWVRSAKAASQSFSRFSSKISLGSAGAVTQARALSSPSI